MKKHFRFLICTLVGLSLTRYLSAQEQAFKGWPQQDEGTDLRTGFKTPPQGYGNVPFYWWEGDSLRLDRMTDQLNLLSDASTDGLSVSYIHTHPKVDIEANAHGYGSFGKTDEGSPRIFSPEWWKLWNSFSKACAEKGIGLGLDDYVVGWAGNGQYVDEVLQSPNFKNYQGRLVMNADGTVTTEPSPILHPDYGKRLIEVYFCRFEDKLDADGRKGMNYFFQDELQYPIDIHSWCEDMPEQFKKRKGYDIVPLLPLLFEKNITERVAKVRLDYAEVLTQLAEERYFRPIFEWNNKRGLIYGCDNVGRGLEPLSYLDYYRITSWFTAPGNDAPARGNSFRQTKVSSSISHVYQRPRTWLEAFHSMGWDSNGQWLRHQLDMHLIGGGNLLCMHGLYYSTHGGWWEWAPPCFHFRMPYWPHMKVWLRYAERMCYVLSQGEHVADVAILYPTETMQAYPGTSPEPMFQVADSLSDLGIDYDYIDYQSLQNAQIKNGCLYIGKEKYSVLLVPFGKGLHSETDSKIKSYSKAGGKVITGCDKAADMIAGSLESRDFIPSSGAARVLHRSIKDQDLYMVMYDQPQDSLFFRAHGKAELWDAFHGTTSALPVKRVTAEGTWLTIPHSEGVSQLVVFSPGTPEMEQPHKHNDLSADTLDITGNWEIEYVPTMNNRWGDFRLPASDELIGTEIREMNGHHYGFGPYLELQQPDGTWQPYRFSWQWGVQDSPGSQGYHGLKGKVDHRFIILDKGGRMNFRTRVYAPETKVYSMVIEGVNPDEITIDGIATADSLPRLSKGWHDLSIHYNSTRKTPYSLIGMKGDTRDLRDRISIIFRDTDHNARLIYNPYGGRQKEWSYEMQTAPGTVSMDFNVAGKIKRIYIDGKKIPSSCILTTSSGYHVDCPIVSRDVAKVDVEAVPDDSVPGAAFFREPVKLQCTTGEIALGDWSRYGALKYYSGGIRYKKTLDYAPKEGARAILDLGSVDATCEVSVNGNKVDVLLNSPYTVDITEYIKSSGNRIEVLVYSSLSNHYQSIPSPYRGEPHAGLFGPVRIITKFQQTNIKNRVFEN